MEFLNPVAGVLALCAIPVVLFHFLNLRRKREPVSTMLFWRQVVRQRRFHAFWERLRHLLALLVGLAFLTLLVCAVADPVIPKKRSGKTVLIFDCSAGMNAKEPDGRTRLEIAKSEALRFLASRDVSEQTAVLATAGAVRIVSRWTDCSGVLRDAVGSLTPSDVPGNPEPAIRLAQRMIRDEPDARIVVWTDGDAPFSEQSSEFGKIELVPVGSKRENVAITRFQARRSRIDPIGYETLVEIGHFGENPIDVRLELHLEEFPSSDALPLEVVPMTLRPGGKETHVLQGTSERGGLLTATLTGSELRLRDALEVDDTAFAFLPKKPPLRVLFYGENDFFLFHVFRSQPNVDFEVIETLPSEIPDDAVVVLHRTVPEMLPKGNLLIVDPRNSCALFEVGEPLNEPLVGRTRSDSPLLRFVRLSDVAFSGARTLRFFSRPEVLAATPGGDPLYVQWNDSGRKALVLATDLALGDLALRTAFPIMISHALAFFRGGDGEWEKAYGTSEKIVLPLETRCERLVLRSPTGWESELPVRSGTVEIAPLPQCGVWELRTPDGEILKNIACNLFCAEESNLAAASEDFYALRNRESRRTVFSRPIRVYLAAAAMLLTCVEWFLYQRRWLA